MAGFTFEVQEANIQLNFGVPDMILLMIKQDIDKLI